MSDDFRVSTALAGHPKIKKLERKLGAAGCWALIVLWAWTADNRPDGSLAGLSDEDIELTIEWHGEAGQFIAVVSSIGLLDGSSGDYHLHDWEIHQPFVASRPQRIAQAKSAADARWARTTPEDRAQVARQLVTARRNSTCAERADRTSVNVPASCDPHVANVPTTPPTPRTPPHATTRTSPTEANSKAYGHSQKNGNDRFRKSVDFMVDYIFENPQANTDSVAKAVIAAGLCFHITIFSEAMKIVETERRKNAEAFGSGL